MSFDMFAIGAIAFGLLVGWCAGMAISGEKRFGIKKLGTLVGVVAGTAVIGLFGKILIAWYFLGLAPAFFLNRFLSMPSVQKVMSEAIEASSHAPDKKKDI